MRWCKWCNCQLGEQEVGAIVATDIVHERCEKPYAKELSDKIAKAERRKFLYLPSIKEISDFPGGC